MSNVKYLRHLLIVPRTGDGDKGINEIADIDRDHEGQKWNGLIERRQGKLHRFEQGEPVRQHIG